MMLITEDREILDLVRRALRRAQLRSDQVLQAWNARIAAGESVAVMESGAAIYLDHVLLSLRVYVGDASLPSSWPYLPVHIREGENLDPSNEVPSVDILSTPEGRRRGRDLRTVQKERH